MNKPSLKDLELAARRVAHKIAPDLPNGAGFALLVFDFVDAVEAGRDPLPWLSLRVLVTVLAIALAWCVWNHWAGGGS